MDLMLGIRVVKAWEERGSCLNIFRTTNHCRISETFTNYEAKDLLCKNLHEFRGKRLVAQVSETRQFALYSRTRVELMLQLESSWHGRTVDHVLTYPGRQIEIGCQKPSRISRQNTCFANEKSWSDLRDLHKLRGKRLVGNVSETRRFALYLRTGMDLMLELESLRHGRSVDLVLTYSGRQITVGSQKPSRITRQKTCSACESNTSVRVVFANRSGFDVPIGVHMACERLVAQVSQTRWSGLYLQTRVDLMLKLESSWHGRTVDLVAQVSETRNFALYLRNGVDLMLELKSSRRGRSVDHVLTYSGRQITVGSQKPSRITKQNPCCASESNTSVRVAFKNQSGFDAPIGVFMAWEDRGSCLNIFRTTNHRRISETFTNYEAKELLRKVVMALEESGSCLNIFQTTNHGRISETFMIYEAKACCASECNMSVRVVFANRRGFYVPIGVVKALEESGSCLNIFQTKNHGRISETFTIYEAKDLLRN
ncbi:uncharacterized protein G2W53_009875 [Senna tora]|uniref:Uncharacterized protein n=1 Tax=Senna tora TaxID=362788 RepID=A0A835C8M9_9FABA|nr:uncharacterized protein G2W53_009875 [Senna tora]